MGEMELRIVFTLYKLGRNEEAIAWIDKALALDPDNVRALERKKVVQDSM
jgi:tetratricopeptide (TPR) repeat protein